MTKIAPDSDQCWSNQVLRRVFFLEFPVSRLQKKNSKKIDFFLSRNDATLPNSTFFFIKRNQSIGRRSLIGSPAVANRRPVNLSGPRAIRGSHRLQQFHRVCHRHSTWNMMKDQHTHTHTHTHKRKIQSNKAESNRITIEDHRKFPVKTWDKKKQNNDED